MSSTEKRDLQASLASFKQASQRREAAGQPSATLGEALNRFKAATLRKKADGDLAKNAADKRRT